MVERPQQLASSLDGRRCAILILMLGIVMALVLWLMGRVWWCELGDYLPWSWDVWSGHNSQHLVDPYSLSHVQHGIGLFLLLSVCGRKWLSIPLCTVIVAIVEASWEISENTPWIIDRYREATISLDYYGDSILNSLGDYAACLIGIAVAQKLKWPWSVTTFIFLEVISIAWIRDSLLLNILMLAYPLEAIKQWQAVV